MLIGHYKQTKIAEAPEEIAKVINKYTEHDAYVFGYSYPEKTFVPGTDLFHLHNKMVKFLSPNIIQYHSEPFRCDLRAECPRLVIAQYHATLREFQQCKAVRNPIDIFEKIYLPRYETGGVVNVGYSPSLREPLSVWADKGYVETVPILERIKDEYKDRVRIDIIEGVSLSECLERKSRCHILIDEVKTPSYHRSGLEGLGMGKVVICSLSKEVEEVLLTSSMAKEQPFINSTVESLYDDLVKLINKGSSSLCSMGLANRLWMEKHWNPITIANEYIRLYEECLGNN